MSNPTGDALRQFFSLDFRELDRDLTEEECGALLQILTVQSRLTVMQQEAIYLRGCYDGIGYLKIAGLF